MDNAGNTPGISFFTVFFGFNPADPNEVDVAFNFIRPRNGCRVLRYCDVSDASLARIIALSDPSSFRFRTYPPHGIFNRRTVLSLTPA
jgi:hypothetical protein